jgi:hypothetical protein
MIINLTQHAATAEQIEAGVLNTSGAVKQRLQALLTFDTLPSREEIKNSALEIARMAKDHGAIFAMIGGAPFLMGLLEVALKVEGITPLYAFSVRESVEETLPDGSVRKINVFKHVGFVEV